MRAQRWRQATLMPFLYQTRTIQQHAIPKRKWPVAEQSEPLKTPNDHIPFEHSEHGSALEIPGANTTITKKEKEIFNRLLTLAQVESKAEEQVELPTVKESGKGEGIVRSQPIPTRQQRTRVTAVQGRNISSAVVDVIKLQEQQAEQDKQFADVKKLLEKSKTDVELWNTLETHVFRQIVQLDLDGATEAAKGQTAIEEEEEALPNPEAEKTKLSKSAKKKLKKEKAAATRLPQRITSLPNPELATVGTNYPLLLLVAMRLLRARFPASRLPFSILPSIKRIGRSSYALGASTPLYNELISLTWRTYSDFTRIHELLQEMENGGLEFDEDTLTTLDEIRLEGNNINKGRYGVNRKALWETDMVQNGWRKVIAWIPVVREGLAEGAEREARGEEFEVAEYDVGT